MTDSEQTRRPDVARRAEQLPRDDDKGGFPPQQQEPPGLTGAMEPVPDHGEETYVGSGRLAGLRTLVTGGDSGIGRAVAIAFAREGADVAIGYLESEEEDARDTASWVEKAGQRAVLVPGDLVDRETCRRVVAETVDGLGGLDVLVNNAGYHWDRGPEGWRACRRRRSSARCGPTSTPRSGSARRPRHTSAREPRSSTPPRSRPTSRPPRCWTTPPPRQRSTTSR